MNRKLVCGIAAVGMLVGGAFADYVIEDFSGVKSAFGEYSGAFTWGDAVLGNPDNPYSAGDPHLTPTGEYGELQDVELGTSGAAAIFVKTPAGSSSITDCEGISFKYKSNAVVQFAAEMQTITDEASAGQYIKNLSANTAQTLTTVNFSALTAEYGTPPTFDLSNVFQLTWSLKAGVSGTDVTDLNLELDDVTCLTSGGGVPLPQAVRAEIHRLAVQDLTILSRA